MSHMCASIPNQLYETSLVNTFYKKNYLISNVKRHLSTLFYKKNYIKYD